MLHATSLDMTAQPDRSRRTVGKFRSRQETLLVGALLVGFTWIGAAFLAAPEVAAEVWFSGVRDPFATQPADLTTGSDYIDLFRGDAPWAQAAAVVRVFKTSTQFISRASDDQLRQLLAGLARRHIALAVEALMLTGSETCGRGVEGYSDPHRLEIVAARIKRFGGELAYVAMDEPLWFGHRYGGAHACRAALADIAQDVAGKVSAIRRSFPAVQVGDIEPFAVRSQPGDWQEEIGAWAEAYRAATGEPLAFFDLDMDWHQPWQPQVAAIAARLRAMRIKLGIIYDGDLDDPSDLAWTRHAELRFAAVEADPALIPDQAILQSWMYHPLRNLPETQAGTMTSLVRRYAADETRITLDRAGDRLEGRLTGLHDTPLAGEPVEIRARDIRNAGPPSVRARSGIVPAGAASALFALRINAECDCTGAAEVTLGALRYREDQSRETVLRRFALPGGVTAPDGIRLAARPGQRVVANSQPWPVTPLKPWTAEVAMGAAEAARSGAVALIFLDGNRTEVRRIAIPFEPAGEEVAKAVTDAAGRFAVRPDRAVLRRQPAFTAEFPGAACCRMATTSVGTD